MATPEGPWPSRALWLAAIVPAIIGLLLLGSSLDAPVPESYGFRGFSALFAVSFGSVGAFVVRRRPGNRVGAILASIGIVSGVLIFLTEYANVGTIAAPGSLPGAVWAAWVASWIWVPVVILAGPLLLSIFPDGRFLSGRWRAIALVGVALGVGSMVVQALQSGPLNNFSSVANPVGLLPTSVVGALAVPTSVGLVLTLLACTASLFVRFRTADRDGRQQLKWFAAAGLLVALAGPLGFSAGKVGQVLFISALCTIPLATGLTVLRYGLYEIDTVINRAIVYGLLTAILAGLYTASVGLMQRVSKLFTGADTEAAVVLTTLIVVTAFTPVKNWLQTRVDRRFKEGRDPGARLSAFVDDLRASFARPDAERTFRRLLRLIVETCELEGGRIVLERPGSDAWVASEGELVSDAQLTIGPFELGSGSVRLVAGPPRRRPTLSPRDRTAVESALASVAEELA